jgi:riboflavin biosynthesis pyrimidine reductase
VAVPGRPGTRRPGEAAERASGHDRRMRRLLPSPADEVDLVAAYAYPDGRPWMRADMVASADGAATVDGYSEGLSGTADKEVFGLLRGLCDVVVVGATTARREGYGPARSNPRYLDLRQAAGQPPVPAIAVVSNSLDLDFTADLFTAATTPTLLITSGKADPAAVAEARDVVEVVVAGEDRVDMAAALDELARRGYRRQLTEGGPHLLGQIVTAGRLDELCLTISPLLTGSDAALRIISGTHFDPPVRLRLDLLLEEDGNLFTRYLAG